MTSNDKEVFWRKHVEAQKQSNLTQIQYCEQQNIICSRLIYWRIRFKNDLVKKKKVTAPKNTFIKLGVTNSKSEIVTLALRDGHRIEIPSTLALSLLPNLLSSLVPRT